ncbi:ER lumen protein-retaining receptor 2 [Aethina tumida]|uniref:ER lumen protein-retaining receptor 2 n=1 Tax=Aethina tumida TaxID=116153 RepID=UPI0021478BB8|nr:ER lumen protein-retaining receptor 2 [Aethina tumida]
MDHFQLIGDILHLVAIFVLLYKLLITKSCSGVSIKTQKLYMLIFITRYMDMFIYFVSWYHITMKVFYIFSALLIVYLIRIKYNKTYEEDIDSFQFEVIPIAAILLAFAVNHRYDAIEILWAFSIYTECAAILPQFYMIYKTGEIKEYVASYLILMGFYRAFYIAHWINRYNIYHIVDLIDSISGVLQTGIYVVFFMMYITASLKPSPVEENNSEPLDNNLNGLLGHNIGLYVESNPMTLEGDKNSHNVKEVTHSTSKLPNTELCGVHTV